MYWRLIPIRWLLLLLAVPLLLGPQPARGQKHKQLTPEEMAKLCKLLRTGDHYKVRLQSAKVLGMMRSPDALPHLVQALRKDPDHLVRSAAAWALGSINHPGAVPELHKAAEKEVSMVRKQARKALDHILASFPDNLPATGKGFYRLRVDSLVDRINGDQELTPWVQQYFLEHFLAHDHVEVGIEMNIEVDGEQPDIDESYKPYIPFVLKGGVSAIKVPEGRRKGDVKIVLAVELELVPSGIKAMKLKRFTGKAPFAGGPKPDDAWADDPLIEAEKKALKAAVDDAFKAVAGILHLNP